MAGGYMQRRCGEAWAVPGRFVLSAMALLRIWNIADEQFYGATRIIDLYHAREHYWNVARACLRAGLLARLSACNAQAGLLRTG